MRTFVARHAETVFNAAAIMQHDEGHTPLTRRGFAQADTMGAALLAHLGPRPRLLLWSSPSGRALQTLAIIAEHLKLDWHTARTDPRLMEMNMGAWCGRSYRDVIGEVGPIYDPETHHFTRRAPGGEGYAEVTARLRAWVEESAGEGDRLVLTHGISARLLGGLLTGAPDDPRCGVPSAPAIAQGSVAMIEDGEETILHAGTA